ncbi:MAG: single-stranded-DNA-specific exonuclease RecJ [Candidatus Pacebacteria bacterium CG_4_10_14_0_8_um_filter_43_12]|nr:MAG: single-stranded-DNA-specific exonuclease RecJ [Candidatus Pacebacteria bacterium CG10_big_fil_rev_8_21_14_0_10_44_11]PIY79489.1 MAG: single-stranded-DNA-specific exonuclease RecJ [Candidatus Pacebacteria bacterium CG_4_10_14_0_8_um_filter_43_12]
MHWQYLSSSVPKNQQDLKAILLKNRQVVDEKSFFSPPLPQTLELKAIGIEAAAIKKAVKRIQAAVKRQEKVVIFGDYDADGICATAILWNVLKETGLVAVPFIPKRQVHGYGITQKAIDEIIEAGKPKVLVTVDNGIVAHQAIKYASDQGIAVILTDHHQLETVKNGKAKLPKSFATIHTTQLSGSGVSWILAREINASAAQNYLDLAALATIADQVPLVGANRSVVFHGLKALQKTNKVGLKALADLGEIDLLLLDSDRVGYSLAPRINAMGRLAHGLDALRLLCTKNWETARKLARTLTETNASRQTLTADQYQLALKQAVEQTTESVLIIASAEFHQGVIGLIAGRLMEKYSKPVIVMAINKTTIKGSARSVAGVNIVELLRTVQADLLEVGGHPMAAGFGLTLEKLEVVKTKLFTVAKQTIKKQLLLPEIELECRLDSTLISLELVKTQAQFEPFGMANPKPVFAITGAKIISLKTLGQDQKHLKLWLDIGGSEPITALYWKNGNLKERLSIGLKIKLAAMVEVNHFNGKQQLQLIVRDLVEDKS